MKRKIVEIDEARCNGCELCANACHEGAIAIVDGKARLVKNDYCDGMGDCLPECPTGAIRIVERDAGAYDEKAVQERKMAKMQEQMRAGGMSLAGKTPPPGGCPGKAMRQFNRTGGPQSKRNPLIPLEAVLKACMSSLKSALLFSTLSISRPPRVVAW